MLIFPNGNSKIHHQIPKGETAIKHERTRVLFIPSLHQIRALAAHLSTVWHLQRHSNFVGDSHDFVEGILSDLTSSPNQFEKGDL